MDDFYAFADESSYTEGRYSSIAAVSIASLHAKLVSEEVADSWSAASSSELKWKRIDGARRRQGACAVLDSALRRIAAGELRIDVVVWDTQDSRHDIRRRDDLQNYERMYFHLHKSVMRRWPKSHKWHLRPDEQVAIEWEKIAECLSHDGTWRKEAKHPLLTGELDGFEARVASMKQMESRQTPLCQLADLFAGLAQYSFANFQKIAAHLDGAAGQASLFEKLNVPKLSAVDKARLEVVSHLDRICKESRLGVSLRSSKGFRTRDPNNPVNFWLYQPQHPADRAPVRNV